jgi:hypothetical protein
MANRLNIDLTNKTVVVAAEHLQKRFKTERERAFIVKGGFGADPALMGRALIGEWLDTGEKDRVQGYMVEKLYEEEG